MLPRLVTMAGAITRVARDGVELFRNDSAEALVAAMAAKRAGGHPAGFAGTITDADGRSLSNAVVQADSVGRAAMTDSAGTFLNSCIAGRDDHRLGAMPRVSAGAFRPSAAPRFHAAHIAVAGARHDAFSVHELRRG
jgi:hypothetical protein